MRIPVALGVAAQTRVVVPIVVAPDGVAVETPIVVVPK
jgi:hypothetical protein